MNTGQISHLKSLVDQTLTTRHPYMACVCGMWAQVYGVLDKSNPFRDEPKLASWWSCGWDASLSANEESQRILKQQKAHEKNWLKKMFSKK